MRIAVLVPEFPALTQTFTYTRLGTLAEKGIFINLFYSKLGDFSLLETSLIKRMTNAGVIFTKLPGDRLGIIDFLRLFIKGNVKINLELCLRFIKKIITKSSIRESLSALFRFAPLIFWQPQIIHIETSYLVHGMLRALEASQKPILISLRGADVDEKPQSSQKWRDFYANSKDKSYIFFHCVSKYVQQKAIKLGVSEIKSQTIYHGLTNQNNSIDYSRKSKCNKIIKIITIARLSHEKGVDLAISAIKYLHQIGVKILYEVIGEGVERSNLEQKIFQLGLDGYVKLWGAKDNDWVREYLRTYRDDFIYLQPSRFEAFAISILEGLFSNLPIIATNVGGIPEIIINEKTGLLCEPDNPVSMAESIKKLIDNNSLRQTIRENGYKFATENFTDKIEAENFINLYSQLIESTIS